MRHDSLRQGLVLAICPSINGGGGIVPDLSGYNNHGTITNMDAFGYTAYQRGIAFNFNGTNNRIVANSLLYSQVNLTVSCWINPRTVSGVQMLISHYGAEGNRAWYLALINSALRILVSPDGTTISFGQGGTVATEWTHVAGVATRTQFLLYINGVPITTTLTGTYPTQIFASTANTILGDRATTDTPFNGQLDDARFYSRILNDTEIRFLASEPGIGLRQDRTSVFFGAELFNAAWARSANVLISPVGAA